MRLILVADRPAPAWGAADERAPACLKPVAGLALLHRIVSHFTQRGVDRIDVVCSRHPQTVRNALGDGTRWGIEIRHHLARGVAGIEEAVMRLLDSCLGEPRVLLGEASVLPHLAEEALDEPARFVHGGRALGWAVVADADVSRRGLPARYCPRVLDARTPGALLASNRVALRHEPDSPGLTAVADWGVFLAPGARVHPDAVLRAPAFVGAETVVEAGARIGPHAVVGRRCIIGASARIRNAVIGDSTAVGDGLRLERVVVEGAALAQARPGGLRTLVADRRFLSDPHAPRKPRGYGDRVVGALLLAGAAPLLALSAVVLRVGRPGPVFRKREVVSLPAPEPDRLRTFDLITFGIGEHPPWRRTPAERLLLKLRLDRLPALVHVVRGQLALRGVRPRSPREVRHLPEFWGRLYVRSRAGWMNTAFRRLGRQPTASESCTADLFAAARGAHHRGS